MANTIDWGKATQNNTNGFGKYQNTIDAGSIYADSYAGETALVGTSAAFSYSKSSYHQDEADPTPTITGTTGGSFNGSAGLVFVDTGTHNSTTGQIDLSASTIDSHIITYTVDGVQSGQTVGVTASPFIANTYSMQFDSASSQYIDVGLFSGLNSATAVTVSAWFKSSTYSNYGRLISNNHIEIYQSQSAYSNTQGRFFYRLRGNFGIPIIDLGGTSASGVGNLVDGNWHHLCITFDNSTTTAVVYEDGVPVITNTSVSGTLNSASSNLYIGSSSASGQFINGKIDEVAIWNTALGETAIQEIYNATYNNTGKALDLTQDSGNYNASSNLQYFNRLGD